MEKNWMLYRLVAIALLNIPGVVQAGQWYFEPDASVRMGYDDNARFSSTNPEGSFSLTGTAQSDFGYRGDHSELTGVASWSSRRFDNLPDLDTDDQSLSLDLKTESELSQFGLQVMFDRDSTLTSELESTGLVQVSSRRERSHMKPYWQHDINERTQLNFAYDHTDVSYDDAAATGLVDYIHSTGNLGLTYQLLENTQLSFSVFGGNFEADAVNTEVDTLAFHAGAIHRFSETFTANLSVGVAANEASFKDSLDQMTSHNNSATLLDAGLTKEWESSRFELSASITETPSGHGRLLRRKALGMKLQTDYSERLNIALNAKIFRNKSGGGMNVAASDRNYFSVTPRFAYELSEWTSLTGEYRYRSQEFTSNNNSSAESNAFFVSLRYRWPMSVSGR
ncbi:MAG: hypothetical protein ABW116_02045 [Candidatus Sedimenticola sp. 20ELBAFRAG]